MIAFPLSTILKVNNECSQRKLCYLQSLSVINLLFKNRTIRVRFLFSESTSFLSNQWIADKKFSVIGELPLPFFDPYPLFMQHIVVGTRYFFFNYVHLSLTVLEFQTLRVDAATVYFCLLSSTQIIKMINRAILIKYNLYVWLNNTIILYPGKTRWVQVFCSLPQRTARYDRYAIYCERWYLARRDGL